MYGAALVFQRGLWPFKLRPPVEREMPPLLLRGADSLLTLFSLQQSVMRCDRSGQEGLSPVSTS